MKELLENIKVHIVKRPDFFSRTDIFIVKYDGSNQYLAAFDKFGMLQFKKLEETPVNPKPTLSLNTEILQKLVDAFSEVQPPTKQAEVDAELKATKYHLEDMRDLIFKKKI